MKALVTFLYVVSSFFFVVSCGSAGEDSSVPVEKDIIGVVLTEESNPVDGATVTIFKSTKSKGLSTSSTNGDGEYFFESLENGTYSILAEHEGKKGVAQNISYATSFSESIIASPITLYGTKQLMGTVLLNGETPQEDVYASVIGTDLIVTSNAQGEFSLDGVPVGDMSVELVKIGLKTISTSIEIVTSNASIIDLGDFSIVSEDRTGTLTGFVELEGKSNHGDVLVTALDYDETATSNTSGVFSMELPLGTFSSFEFSAVDFTTKIVEGAYEITEGGTTDIGTVVLIAGANTIEGQVTLYGKTDYEGVSVVVQGTNFQTTTDESGDYQIEHVPLGDYTLVFSYPNASTVLKVVTVEAADSIQVASVELQPAGHMKGIFNLDLLTDYSEIQVVPVSGIYSYEFLTLENGAYEFSNLPIGVYVITGSRIGFDDFVIQNVTVNEGVTTDVGLNTLIDSIDPISTDDAEDTWVNTDVTLNLTAEDSGVGVSTINYIMDSTTFSVSENGPPVYTDEGIHSLVYWAVDRSGNEELQHTATTIRIDKSIQIVSMSEDTNGVKKGKGDTVHLSVDTAEPLGEVNILIENLDLELKDDGQNGDESSGDGVYSLTFTIDETIDANSDRMTVSFVDKATNTTMDVLIADISLDGIAPIAPQGVDLVPTSHEIEVIWDKNSEDDIAGYNVWKSSSKDGAFVQLNTSLVTSNSYIDDGLTNVEIFYYYVTAQDENGNISTDSESTFGFAASYRGGTLISSENWDPDDNPFIIVGDVIVDEAAVITIQPGALIWGFLDGHLIAEGQIKALGKEDNKITFVSFFDLGDEGYWKGVTVKTDVTSVSTESDILENGSVFDHCVITDAEYGISIEDGGSAIIKNTELSGNNGGVYLLDSGMSFIHDNQIKLNTQSGIIGDASENGVTQRVTINDNQINTNVEYGINFLGHISGTIRDFTIQGNAIGDNAIGGIRTSDINESTFTTNVIKANTFSNSDLFTIDGTVGLILSGETNEAIENSFLGHHTGLKMVDSVSNTIKNNTFKSNSPWAISMSDGTINNLIERNDIILNSNGIRIGVSTIKMTVLNNLIRYNHIVANSGLAVLINSGPQDEIEFNNIFNNNSTGVNQVTTGVKIDMDFDSNYWNTPNPKTVKTYIYDFYDNPDLGKVGHEPFLEKLVNGGVSIDE
ncbi:hypothetical protein HOH45_08655 [bacterium]|nr:hypothetical protein [bacterium]